MTVSIVITTYKETNTIEKCVECVLFAIVEAELVHKDLNFELIIVSGDTETKQKAQEYLRQKAPQNIDLFFINDGAKGKWNAMNLAHEKATGEILIFTDGDVYIEKTSITRIIDQLNTQTELVATGGHPISINERKSKFGYYSHLFCQAAHLTRQNNTNFTPMSGYLLAIRKNTGVFPLPKGLRAEDAYISSWIYSNDLKFGYNSEALVKVKFPNNSKDWIKQKTRSLGGNVQLRKFTANLPQNKRTHHRNMLQDLKMVLFPLEFATNLTEIYYSFLLYFLRTYLWGKIYYIHLTSNYKSGAWESIKSTK